MAMPAGVAPPMHRPGLQDPLVASSAYTNFDMLMRGDSRLRGPDVFVVNHAAIPSVVPLDAGSRLTSSQLYRRTLVRLNANQLLAGRAFR